MNISPALLLERWILDIQPGERILDLGSGDFHFAKKFMSLSATVDCLDNEIAGDVPRGARYIKMNLRRASEFEGLIEVPSYNRFFMRNTIQFIEKGSAEDLVSCICNRAVRGSRIYIQSFFADPKPSFKERYNSYWSAGDLRNLFNDRKCQISTAQDATVGRDESGTLRTFYISALDSKFL